MILKILTMLFVLACAGGFVTAQNVGINNPDPIGKLTINTPAANHNSPSLLLIDSATNNSGGAVLQFRNSIDKRMYLQSHFGTAANGSDSYLTFSYDGFYNMRLRGDGLLGIGTTTPAYAGLEVNKKVGKVLAAFGTNEAGVSIESNVPGIHFNNFNYDGSRKAMIAGYGGGIEFNHITGTLGFYNSSTTAATGTTLSTLSNKMFINKNGNVGIGVQDPLALLHINGHVKINGNNSLEFGHGITKEENAGKIGYGLFTPETLEIIGAGTAYGNRRIRLWAEEATEFTGNADVFGNLRVRGLQGTGSKRQLYADSAGNIVSSAEIQYLAFNASDFTVWPFDGASQVVRKTQPGADTYYFGSASTYGKGYFITSLNLPAGATIISVKANYLSKIPENGTAAAPTCKLGVTFYEQGIDPTYGAFSTSYPVFSSVTIANTTSTWNVTGGGPNVTNNTVTNTTTGLYTLGPNQVSLVVYGNTGSNDFRANSNWLSNGGFSFHSIIIGYRL